MHFYPDQLFHIYNQGNNQQAIFFSDENYLYFLWKMRAYLPLFGDLVAYCLMPNHFHWLFQVRQVEISEKLFKEHVERTEAVRRLKQGHRPKRAAAAAGSRAKESSLVTLNEAIGILEQSYARAINRQEDDRSGSLFRKPCKAKDGWIDEFVTLEKRDGKLDTRFLPGTSYAWNCFHYIHDNPEAAGLVENKLDWPYSSARDYAGLRRGTLCNVELGRGILEGV